MTGESNHKRGKHYNDYTETQTRSDDKSRQSGRDFRVSFEVPYSPTTQSYWGRIELDEWEGKSGRERQDRKALSLIDTEQR